MKFTPITQPQPKTQPPPPVQEAVGPVEVVSSPLNPTPPGKRVVFTAVNEKWGIQLENNDPSTYFTDRDFNHLVRILTVQRVMARKQAFILYRKNQQAKAGESLTVAKKV